MAAASLRNIVRRGLITPSHLSDFKANGFTVVHNFLDASVAAAVAARVPKIFAGEFDTVSMSGCWWQAVLLVCVCPRVCMWCVCPRVV